LQYLFTSLLPVIQALLHCNLLFVCNGVLDNSITLYGIRYIFAQMGPSGFNELCGTELDWSWPALG